MFRTLIATLCLAVTTMPMCHAFTQPVPARASRVSTKLQDGGLFGEGNPIKNLFGKQEQTGGPKVMVDLSAKEISQDDLARMKALIAKAQQRNEK